MVRITTAALGILLLGTGAAMAEKTQWIHVAVDGTGEDAERVRVNVPLVLVETVLPLIDEDDFHGGKIVLEDEELTREDLVAILRAVRDAEDGVYVTVDDRDDFVRVAKENDYLLLKVEEKGDDTTHVEARVPVTVLDALVSGDGDELDLLAAIRALGDHGEGDLVTVDDDGTRVRIWIDQQNESE